MSIDVRLIGLDWGTSSLRAYLYGADGQIVASRQQDWGIRQLPDGGFPAALKAMLEDWPSCAMVAAGMVGSRQGWREVPYVEVPADASAIARAMVSIDTDAGALWIAPGLHQVAPANVMRGEETQILGALALHPELRANARFVLPGTHSKWAAVNDDRIVAFDTVMTGEIYALLLKHSILGAGVPKERTPSPSGDAFERGLFSAKESGAAGVYGRLFSVRARMLDGELHVQDVPDFLSGLLIGEEFRIASVREVHASGRLCLIGEPSLCARYVTAAKHFGYAEPAIIGDAAAAGLWQLATQSGVLAQAPSYRFSGADV